MKMTMLKKSFVLLVAICTCNRFAVAQTFPTIWNTSSYFLWIGMPISMLLGVSDDGQYGWIGSQTSAPVILGANTHPVILLDGEGQNAYVGLSTNEFQSVRSDLKSKISLFVKKGILSEDYSIAPIASWVDFVFDEGYVLRPLDEVEEFVGENGHLPDVPSAQEIAKDGYSQHEINKVLLQKIEELTLYAIRQQKEIESLKAQLMTQRK